MVLAPALPQEGGGDPALLGGSLPPPCPPRQPFAPLCPPGGLFLPCLSPTGTELRVSISPRSGAWVSCSSTSSHRSADEGRAVHLLIFQVGEEPSVTWVQREVTARGKVSGFTKPVLSLYCSV